MSVEPALLAYMDMELAPCQVCDGATYEVLAAQDRYRMGLRTVGCKRCGLIFTNPRPTAAAIDEFYAHGYRRFYQSVVAPSAEYIATLRKDDRADAVGAHILGWLQPGDIRNVVDVGCAEGSLLKSLSSALPSARFFGVEVNAPFADFAREYTGASIVSSIDELPTARFDLVILNHVLEHVGDPNAYLRKVAGLLSPNGRLYVAVPDAASYGGLGDLHIAHLFHYTRVSLARLLLRANLVVVRDEIVNPPNHPTTLAVVARVADRAETIPLSLDTSGWSNVRTANRFASLYYLRRHVMMRRVASTLKRLLRS